MSSFKDEMKSRLGDPLIDVELYETTGAGRAVDHYDRIMQDVLRVVRTYLPMLHIIRKSVPSSSGLHGEGRIDVSTEGFLSINNVYLIKPKIGTADILLPWSIARIWEQIWIGKTEFLGADLLLYQNEIRMLNQATNKVFAWEWDGSYVYITNAPSWASGVGIQGFKGVDDLDSIDENLNEYKLAMDLALAKAKIMIGQILRKHRVEGMEMPGQEMISEGKDEEKSAMDAIEEQAPYPGGLST